MYSPVWLLRDTPLAHSPGAYCAVRKPFGASDLPAASVPASGGSFLKKLGFGDGGKPRPASKPGDARDCTHHVKDRKAGEEAVFYRSSPRGARLSEGTTEAGVGGEPPFFGKARKDSQPLARYTVEMRETGEVTVSENDGKAAVQTSFKGVEVLCVVESVLSGTSVLVVTEGDVLLLVFESDVSKRHFVSAAAHSCGRSSRHWIVDALSLARLLDILTLAVTARRRHVVSKTFDPVHRQKGARESEKIFAAGDAAVVITDTLADLSIFTNTALTPLLQTFRSLGDFYVNLAVAFHRRRRFVCITERSVITGLTHTPSIATYTPFALLKDSKVYATEYETPLKKKYYFISFVEEGRGHGASPTSSSSSSSAEFDPLWHSAPLESTRSVVEAELLRAIRRYEKEEGFAGGDDSKKRKRPAGGGGGGGGDDDDDDTLGGGFLDGVGGRCTHVGPIASQVSAARLEAELRTGFEMASCTPLFVDRVVFTAKDLQKMYNSNPGGDETAAAPLSSVPSFPCDPFASPFARCAWDGGPRVTPANDAQGLTWGRYTLHNNLDRLLACFAGVGTVGATRRAPKLELPRVALSLAKACGAEGLVPSLLAASMNLEIRERKSVKRLLLSAGHEENQRSPSLPSLIISMYAGAALYEWSYGVLTSILRELRSTGPPLYVSEEKGRNNLRRYVIYIVRALVLSDRDRTVPPELRAVVGALNYACVALGGEAEKDKAIHHIGALLMERGFLRVMNDPRSMPVSGDFEVLSQVLQAVLTQRPFEKKDGEHFLLFNDWIGEQRGSVAYLYHSIASVDSMPEGFVVHPGVPGGITLDASKKTGVARLSVDLSDHYSPPPALLPALTPYVACFHAHSFEMMLNAWNTEDQLTKKAEFAEQLKDKML